MQPKKISDFLDQEKHAVFFSGSKASAGFTRKLAKLRKTRCVLLRLTSRKLEAKLRKTLRVVARFYFSRGLRQLEIK